MVTILIDWAMVVVGLRRSGGVPSRLTGGNRRLGPYYDGASHHAVLSRWRYDGICILVRAMALSSERVLQQGHRILRFHGFQGFASMHGGSFEHETFISRFHFGILSG